LATQEHARVAAQAHGSGKRALVIGGHGKMGGWFAEFLASQGFRVAIADPMGGLPGFDTIADWQSDPLDFDLIVLATPLSATTRLLEFLAQRAAARADLRSWARSRRRCAPASMRWSRPAAA
jgi:chorismate mutase/prephenate dehydrogenase